MNIEAMGPDLKQRGNSSVSCTTTPTWSLSPRYLAESTRICKGDAKIISVANADFMQTIIWKILLVS